MARPNDRAESYPVAMTIHKGSTVFVLNPRVIIQQPVITERALMLRESNKYAFRV